MNNIGLISDRVSRQLENASALLIIQENEIAFRLIACARQRECKTAEDGRSFYLPAYQCQSRYCEFCFWKESRKRRRKYLEKILAEIAIGSRMALLTLTTPARFLLSPNDYDILFANFRNLIHQDLIAGKLIGCLAKAETTVNIEAQTYNLHIHAILFYFSCIPHQEIKSAWGAICLSATGYTEVCDIPGRDSQNTSTWIEKVKLQTNDTSNARKVVTRVINYLFKFNTISNPEAFAEYYRATKGKRLLRASGVLRKRVPAT